MTTKWADGFDDTTVADAIADYNFDSASGMTIIAGRRLSSSAIGSHSQGWGFRKFFGGTASTILMSMAYRQASVSPGFQRSIWTFLEGNTPHINIGIVNGTGAIAAWRGGAVAGTGTLLGTGISGVFTPLIWTWIQMKIVIHDTTGSVEVRDASGGVLLNLTNIDTRNGGTGFCDTVYFGSGNGGVTGHGDDWHIWDTTGSICNDWTNDTRIDSVRPSAAGNATQFTPSSGANWECVDEGVWNTTDFVDSSIVGHKDSFACTDIVHSPPTIFGVVRTAVAQKDDAGDRALKLLTRRGGTDYVGNATTLNMGSYTRVFDVQEADPSTAAAWTAAGVNAAEFGFENE